MVEIKINVKEASKEEIRKTIHFLQQFLDDSSTTSINNSVNDTGLEADEGVMNIFSQDNSSQNKKNEEKNSDGIDIRPIFY